MVAPDLLHSRRLFLSVWLLGLAVLLATPSVIAAAPKKKPLYYYAYAAGFCQLYRDDKPQKYFFVGEIIARDDGAAAQRLRTRLQDDIVLDFPKIRPLPSAISLSPGYATWDEADDNRRKIAAQFAGSDNTVIWIH